MLYTRAANLLVARPNTIPLNTRVGGLTRWSQATPETRRWTEDNRDALAVYLRGAERPDALDRGAPTGAVSFAKLQALSSLHLIAVLEASRLEEQGDMAGAWDYYRACLRTMHHIRMHAGVYRRDFVLRWWHPGLKNRVLTWSGDARTSPALLRRALDDILACEALTAPEVDSLKASYIEVNWLLEFYRSPGRQVPMARFRRYWSPDYTLDPETIQSLWDWWRFWRREPERSRHVTRLVTANWLTYFEMVEGDRPKPDPSAVFLDLYSFGPETPAQRGPCLPQRWTAGSIRLTTPSRRWRSWTDRTRGPSSAATILIC